LQKLHSCTVLHTIKRAEKYSKPPEIKENNEKSQVGTLLANRKTEQQFFSYLLLVETPGTLLNQASFILSKDKSLFMIEHALHKRLRTGNRILLHLHGVSCTPQAFQA
jgi:hypothetical protein